MTGGNYTIDGGFWGIIAAVQTPGAPLLSIARTKRVAVTLIHHPLRQFWAVDPAPSATAK